MQKLAASLAALALVTGAAVAALVLRSDGTDALATSASPGAAFSPVLVPAAIEDASGDATEEGAAPFAGWATCLVGGVLGTGCAESPSVGTPAPQYDLLAAGVAGETADTVTLYLDVVSLSEGFPELAAPDGLHRMVWYSLCWGAQAYCDRGASLQVMVHDGVPHAESSFSIWTEACNEWWWCAWSVPAHVTFGAPARISFDVPKAYVAFDGGVPAIAALGASTWSYTEATAFPMWHPGLTVHTPARHVHTHGGGVGKPAWHDGAGGALETAYVPAATGIAATSATPLMVMAPGAMHAAGGPYDMPGLDLLAFDLHEEGPDLVARFLVADLRQVPEYDFDYSVAVGIAGSVWEIGYRHEGGDAYGYAGRCIMEECQDGPVMEPVVDVTLGEPGIVAVRVPLAFVGAPAPGTATSLLWAMTMYSDVNHYWGEHGGDMYGDYHSVFMVDAMVGGAPYVFGSGHKADLALPAVHGH